MSLFFWPTRISSWHHTSIGVPRAIAARQGFALRMLKPKNVMHESISGDFELVHVLSVQEPEIESHHPGQGYQDNPEHYLF